MAWIPAAFGGAILWLNSPSTPLDADNLNLSEAEEAAYAVQLVQSAVDYFEGGSSAKVPVKPNPGRIHVWVDADAGSDANDGRSYGTPLKTVAAAVAAMPNGGPIGLAPSASTYSITAPLNLTGHSIQTIGRAPSGTQGLAVLEHNFNGDMISCGANGAYLRNLLIYQDFVVTGRTGAALSAASSSSVGGEILGENLIFSGGDGWERNLVLDGSLWPTFGIRKCVFINCQFFGARTAGESIKIIRGVHCKFLGGFQDQAPTAIGQGIKILDVGTTDAQFIGFRLIGDFYTEAGGDLLYVGPITGNVTCAAGSANNRFVGRIGGTFSNSGSLLTNTTDSLMVWNTIPYATGWSTSTAPARWAIDQKGIVHLDGRISTTGAGTQINSGDTLPHPTNAVYMTTEANLALAVVTMSAAGALALATPAGAVNNLSLAGLRYPTN